MAQVAEEDEESGDIGFYVEKLLCGDGDWSFQVSVYDDCFLVTGVHLEKVVGMWFMAVPFSCTINAIIISDFYIFYFSQSIFLVQ